MMLYIMLCTILSTSFLHAAEIYYIHTIDIRPNIQYSDDTFIGEGSFGKVYLIDGYAVKVSPYEDPADPVICISRETTALLMKILPIL